MNDPPYASSDPRYWAAIAEYDPHPFPRWCKWAAWSGVGCFLGLLLL